MAQKQILFFAFIFCFTAYKGSSMDSSPSIYQLSSGKTGCSLVFIASINIFTLVPWVIKPLWTPLIESRETRESCLLGCIAGIAVSLSLIQPFAHSKAFFCVIFLVNIFSSTKDLVIGFLLLSELDSDDMNAFGLLKVTAYKFGALFGGGGALWLASTVGFTTEIFTALSALYSIIFISFLCKLRGRESILSKPEIKDEKAEKLDQPEILCDHHGEPEMSHKPCVDENVSHNSHSKKYLFYRYFQAIYRTHGALWLIICSFIYKFSSHSSNLLFTMALVDRGMAVATIGLMSGIAGQIISLAMSGFTGSIMASKRLDGVLIQLVVSIVDVLSVSFQLFLLDQDSYGTADKYVFLSFCIQHAVLGAKATAMFTLMLQHSKRAPTQSQAFLYSVLSTVETIGVRLGMFGAGVLAQHAGYHVGLCVSLAVAVGTVALFAHAPRSLFQTRRKSREMADVMSL